MSEGEKSMTRIKLTQFHIPAPETYNLLGSEAKEKVRYYVCDIICVSLDDCFHAGLHHS